MAGRQMRDQWLAADLLTGGLTAGDTRYPGCRQVRP
jgi:hypothetical protein